MLRALCLRGVIESVSIKNVLLDWLPEILLFIFIGAMFFYVSDIRDHLHLLREHVNDEQNFNFAMAKLDSKIAQILVFCIFFVGIFNLKKRKHNKSSNPDAASRTCS